MARFHSEEEVRRFDLMKLGVLLLLLVLLALSWVATRDNSPEQAGMDNQELPELAEGGEGPDSTAVLPSPTLAAPSIQAPEDPVPPGSVSLNGTAGPGARLVILVDDQPAGAASAGVDGSWSAVLDLPAGEYVVQVLTLDNVGTVVAESEPVELVVGAESAVESAFRPPDFDPLNGNYTFSGVVDPNETVTLVSGEAELGTTTADDGGFWTLVLPSGNITGDVILRVGDAAGNITYESGPVTLGPRPPTVDSPGPLTVDPVTGEVALPVEPGDTTWTGQGQPGTRVELLVDGIRAGLADVDVAGQWSLPFELPPGTYAVQLNVLDPTGDVMFSATPFTVVAGGEMTEEGGAATAEPTTTSPAATPAAAADQTIGELLSTQPDFSTLFLAAQTAGLLETLAGQGPFTVFAPTNDAFARLPQQVVDGLIANPQILSQVLQYHISRGIYRATDLIIVQPSTLNGRLLTITRQSDSLLVNDAIVVTPDIMAGNGVIHTIDRILVPPLAEGVRPPVIDASGVPVFTGTDLTVVGSAEPNRTILVELNSEPFGQTTTVGADGSWAVRGNVTPGDYQIIAYMLDANGALEAISRPVTLRVQ